MKKLLFCLLGIVIGVNCYATGMTLPAGKVSPGTALKWDLKKMFLPYSYYDINCTISDPHSTATDPTIVGITHECNPMDFSAALSIDGKHSKYNQFIIGANSVLIAKGVSWNTRQYAEPILGINNLSEKRSITISNCTAVPSLNKVARK